jgi:serine protease Do
MASRKTGIIIGVAAAGVAAAALAGGGVRWAPSSALAMNHSLPLTHVSNATIFSPPPGAPLSFADIFERVSPAVVSIEVTSHVDPRTARRLVVPGLPFALPGPDGQGDEGGEDGGKGAKTQSSGSGFFITGDGYIVTNNHVVENAEDIKVTLKGGKEMPAKIVGRDEATDLAVLKVAGTGYPFVDFENSAKPRVGDWVIAVGNPFGLDGTATAGIVSAYGRDIGDSFVDFIQIDAPINRGNSGGPTFDIYGRVIGVNSAIFSPSGGSVGIGFAIPSDVADTITKQLIAGGKITRGYLGATIQNVTPDIAESLGIPGKKGALVAQLVHGGPAERGGVQGGDVIVELNGHDVGSSTELTRMVALSHAGDPLRVTLLRGGKVMTLNVRSGVRPTEAQLASNDNSQQGGGAAAPNVDRSAHPSILGMTFGPTDDAGMHNRLGLPADIKGAAVLSVKGASDAKEKGLQAGDVVVRAGDHSVRGPADIPAAVAEARHAGRSSILLGVWRDGRTTFVAIKLEG